MKLEREEIFFINAFDSETGVAAKDVLIEQKNATFLVKDEDMGKAIGPKGSKIKKLTEKLGRRIELLAFTESIEEFFKKALPTAQFSEVKIEGKQVELRLDSMQKREIMGNSKFKRIKRIAERNYNIENIKIR